MDENVGLHQNALENVGPPATAWESRSGRSVFIFCILEVLALDNPRTAVYNKDKERRWLHSGQLPPLGITFYEKIWPLELETLGRSFFLSFFRIVLCPRFVSKDIPRDHPCHIDDTDDDCSQKVQCGKNNIQNIHNGFPPLGISCRNIRTVRRTTEIELPPDLTSGESMTAALAGQRLSNHRITQIAMDFNGTAYLI